MDKTQACNTFLPTSPAICITVSPTTTYTCLQTAPHTQPHLRRGGGREGSGQAWHSSHCLTCVHSCHSVVSAISLWHVPSVSIKRRTVAAININQAACARRRAAGQYDANANLWLWRKEEAGAARSIPRTYIYGSIICHGRCNGGSHNYLCIHSAMSRGKRNIYGAMLHLVPAMAGAAVGATRSGAAAEEWLWRERRKRGNNRVCGTSASDDIARCAAVAYHATSKQRRNLYVAPLGTYFLYLARTEVDSSQLFCLYEQHAAEE